jgi:hypothetical protein
MSRGTRLAALAPALLLASCGGGSRATPRVPVDPPAAAATSVVEPALQRLKAPPGFRVGTCKFAEPRSPSVRCFRHKSFIALGVGVFTALIKDSGLAPVHSTLVCPHLLRPRPGAAMTRDWCQGRADAGSTEFAVYATAIKVRAEAIKPSDRTIATKLRGTVFEVAIVEH